MRAVVVGDLVLDLIAMTPGQLDRGTDTRGEIYPRPGGSPANTATWLARLGQPVLFVGRVGADPLGASLVAGLRTEGVDPRVAVDSGAPTGIILSLVEPGGERSMLISPGANRELAPSDLPLDALATASLIHLTGYSFFWEAPRRTALAALAMAREHGIRVSVDASSTALLAQYGPQRLLSELAGVDCFVCNLAEGRLLTGRHEPAAVLDALAGAFPTVGLKLGAAGSICAQGSLRVEQGACATTALDSTGCGDSWDAGLLAGRLAGADLAGAARLAACTAAWVAARPGAVPPGWTRDDREAVWAEVMTVT